MVTSPLIATLIVGGSGCEKVEAPPSKPAPTETEPTANHSEHASQKLFPPVTGKAKLACAHVIDLAKFTQALGESAPLTVTESNSEPGAAASCSLIRGGRRVSEREQLAMKKRHGRLGVLPGDELLNISTFCWTIEDADHFASKCLEKKDKLDNALGFQACIHTNATGEHDVYRYQFYDPDTKCILQVRAGPSLVDNSLIGKGAKAAYDLIGPEQIRPR